MKNAVILGATAGVGRAITEMLTDSGYNTIGFHRGRQQFGGLRIHTLLKNDAGSNRGKFFDAFASLEDLHVGPIDIVVHSLTGASTGSIMDIDIPSVESTFNSLAHSFLWWVRSLVKHDMISPTARLIALSNPCPDFYLRNTGVIGAAKAALEAYVKMLAVELGPSGVRVNCIRFGMVRTPAIEKVLDERALYKMTEINNQLTPGGKMQTAADVANVVKLLVSDEGYFINGAIIDATGGATLTLLDDAFYGPR